MNSRDLAAELLVSYDPQWRARVTASVCFTPAEKLELLHVSNERRLPLRTTVAWFLAVAKILPALGQDGSRVRRFRYWIASVRR